MASGRVYILLDGIEIAQTFRVSMPQGLNTLVKEVAFAPCVAPEEAWREFRTNLGKLIEKRALCDEAVLYIDRRLGDFELHGDKLRVLDPPPDELGLRYRGVMQVACQDMPSSVDCVAKFVKRVKEELRPLWTLLDFAQRRRCSPRDMIVVCQGSLLSRVHETGVPSVDPARGYGALVAKECQKTFLRSAISAWAAKKGDPEWLARIELAVAYHSMACAQRAVIETRFLEHYAALDIVTDLMVGAPCEQMQQFRQARDKLLTVGWPESVLPKVCEIQQAYQIRNDLAHARRWKILSAQKHERNRQKILEATEHIVTLLEQCLLWIFGFGGRGPNNSILVSLPFKLTGQLQWSPAKALDRGLDC